MKLYQEEGVGTEYLKQTSELATGVGFIIVDPNGSNGIILDMGANKRLNAALVAQAEPLISRSTIVISVLEVPLEAAGAAMSLGRKHGVRTILNPAPGAKLSAEMLSNVDILTPNETELRILMGLGPDDPTPTRDLALRLWKQYGTFVIVTRGENGMLLVDGDGAREFDANRVPVVDTTGAGDAFTAALAVALAEGKELEDAVRFAGCNGALACTKLGVIPSLARRAAVDKLFNARIHSQL